MEDLASNTSQILQDCVELFLSPTHETYLQHTRLETGRQNQASFYDSPDIRYFQKIKQKNHFLYHKSKKNRLLLENIRSSKVYDPYNHDGLVERIKTYTAMNWNIPNIDSTSSSSSSSSSPSSPSSLSSASSSSTITPLQCARNGWKCISYSTNHLLCSYCNHQLLLTFDDDPEPEHDINHLLISKYLHQIECSGHDDNCIWRTFEAPLGIYYPRPYLNTTNELLIRDYIQNLNNLVNNSLILGELGKNFDGDKMDTIVNPDFIKVSNQWLLHRYLKDNKENFSSLLELTPPWFYGLAALGWSIHIQTFAKQTILLLVCNKCNQRQLLNTEVDVDEIKLPQFLTPVKGAVSSTNYILQDFEPMDHKPWCCNINKMTGTDSPILYQYLVEMVKNSLPNIGPDGEYIVDSDILMNSDLKRRKSFDIDDGLNRLNKLRRLYLMDDLNMK